MHTKKKHHRIPDTYAFPGGSIHWLISGHWPNYAQSYYLLYHSSPPSTNKPLLPPMYTLPLPPHTPPHILLTATQSRKHCIQPILTQTRRAHDLPKAGHEFRAHIGQQTTGELEAAQAREQRVEEMACLLTREFKRVGEVARGALVGF
jgi:hypothetical protein